MEQLTQGPGTDAHATLALLGGLNSQTDGVELAYQVLDLVVARYRLSEAHLVLRPGSMAPQIFVHGRRHVTPEHAVDLARRPSGLYASPDVVPMTVQDALTGCCEMALAAHAARRHAVVDGAGLSSHHVIEEGVRRAASRSARFRWRFSLVLLTTSGAGSPGERWQALAAAVRTALRVCDEAGMIGPGRAMAILANAGPEDVEPFVERLRSSLEAAHGRDVRLLAGSVTAPTDSVDPDQLWRLCEERLSDALPEPRGSDVATRSRRRPVASEIELELRCLPDVVSVGTTGLTGPDARVRSLTVVARRRSEELRQAATQLAAEHLGDIPVAVLDGGGPPVPTAPLASLGAVNGVSAISPNGGAQRAPVPVAGGRTSRDYDHDDRGTGSPVPAGGGEGDEDLPPGAPRIVLLRSTFDRSTGASEVSLSWRGLQAAGRAKGSPLASAAQATLTAVEALGADVPYFLASVERATAQPGSPVVVALAERPGDGRAESERRVGVAVGDDDVEAASRATLAALNRLLSKSPDAR